MEGSQLGRVRAWMVENERGKRESGKIGGRERERNREWLEKWNIR